MNFFDPYMAEEERVDMLTPGYGGDEPSSQLADLGAMAKEAGSIEDLLGADLAISHGDVEAVRLDVPIPFDPSVELSYLHEQEIREAVRAVQEERSVPSTPSYGIRTPDNYNHYFFDRDAIHEAIERAKQDDDRFWFV